MGFRIAIMTFPNVDFVAVAGGELFSQNRQQCLCATCCEPINHKLETIAKMGVKIT
jgi:hypothetical protein